MLSGQGRRGTGGASIHLTRERGKVNSPAGEKSRRTKRGEVDRTFSCAAALFHTDCEIRITSYNVCYTKLLRADIEGRMADLKATLDEIRAYETEARGLLKRQGG